MDGSSDTLLNGSGFRLWLIDEISYNEDCRRGRAEREDPERGMSVSECSGEEGTELEGQDSKLGIFDWLTSSDPSSVLLPMS